MATQLIVQDFPPPITGTIMVDVEEDASSLTLSGSGNGWSASDNNLQLSPGSIPAHYRLTFKLTTESASAFLLEGVQVFFQTTAPNTQLATIFFPGSTDEVELGFLNNMEDGGSVSYQLFIGVRFHHTSLVHWPDPTISFEPQM